LVVDLIALLDPASVWGHPWSQIDLRSVVRRIARDFDAVLTERMAVGQDERRRNARLYKNAVPPDTVLSGLVIDSVSSALELAVESIKSKHKRHKVAGLFTGQLHHRTACPITIDARMFNTPGGSSSLTRAHLGRLLDCGVLNLPPAASAVTLRLREAAGDNVTLTYQPSLALAAPFLVNGDVAKHWQVKTAGGGLTYTAPDKADATVGKFVMKEQAARPHALVSIDPGVKTFATVYLFETNETIELGTKDALGRDFNKVMHALQRDVDAATALARRTKGTREGAERALAAARAHKRLHDYVAEMHHRVIKKLLSIATLILLPNFESQSMAMKQQPGGAARCINKAVSRDLMCLSHYKFKQRLMSAVRYHPGVRVIDCSEEWTSRTCSQCARIHPTLGGNRWFQCPHPACRHREGRDAQAARSVLTLNLIHARRRFDAWLASGKVDAAAPETHVVVGGNTKASQFAAATAHAKRAVVLADTADACAAEARTAASEGAGLDDDEQAAADAAKNRAGAAAGHSRAFATAAQTAASGGAAATSARMRQKNAKAALSLAWSWATKASEALDATRTAARTATPRAAAEPGPLFGKKKAKPAKRKRALKPHIATKRHVTAAQAQRAANGEAPLKALKKLARKKTARKKTARKTTVGRKKARKTPVDKTQQTAANTRKQTAANARKQTAAAASAAAGETQQTAAASKTAALGKTSSRITAAAEPAQDARPRTRANAMTRPASPSSTPPPPPKRLASNAARAKISDASSAAPSSVTPTVASTVAAVRRAAAPTTTTTTTTSAPSATTSVATAAAPRAVSPSSPGGVHERSARLL
jgi:hypothetical protein